MKCPNCGDFMSLYDELNRAKLFECGQCGKRDIVFVDDTRSRTTRFMDFRC